MHVGLTKSSVPLVMHRLWAPLLAGLSYFSLASLTTYLTSINGSVATIWPADAVVLAILLRNPKRRWTPILLAAFLGNFVANMAMRGPITGSVLFSLSNLIGVVTAAWVLHSPNRSEHLLPSPAALGRFILWAGLLASAASALCGAATAAILFGQSFPASFARWLLSDSLGYMICTPFLFALFGGQYRQWFIDRSRSQRWKAAALLALTAAATVFVFTRDYPVVFLLYMPILLVTFQLNWLGTKLAVIIVAILGSITIMCGLGPVPLLFPDRSVQILGFQLFLLTMLLTAYPIAAVLAARQRLMDELQENERSLRLLASQSPILILDFDLTGVCKKALGASEMLLDRDAASLIGHSFSDISEEGYLELRAAHERAIDEPDSIQSVEFRAFRVNGKWLEATFRMTADENGRCLGTLATIHDVTERKQQELTLARSATTDSLTGLLNRAGFMARLEMALADAPADAMSIAMIDVDRFKLINDNAGHQAGDAVLREIATRIAAEVRSSDAVGRLGGDEFVILLTTPDWDKAQEICSRVVEAVNAETIQLPSGSPLKAAISCGVAQYKAGLSAEDFINEADLALYQAKRGGRNRMVAA